MAKKSTNNTKRKKKNTTKKISNDKSIEQVFIWELVAVFVFAISIFMLLSLFGIGAGIGEVIKKFQLGLFGILGYIFPFIFLISYLLFFANRTNTVVKIKITMFVLMYILLASFIQLFSNKDFTGFSGIKEAYILGSYGGLIGSLVAGYLSGFIGRIGTGLLLIAIIFSCYLFISGISFIDFVNSISKLFYTRAKEDLSRFANERRLRKLKYEEEYAEEEYIDESEENLDIVDRSERKIFRGISIPGSAIDVEERIEKYNKNKKINIKDTIEKSLKKKKEVDSKKKETHVDIENPSTEYSNDKADIFYKNNTQDFATPEESKIENTEDIFTGIIINSNSKQDVVENLDEDIIAKASNILSNKDKLDISENYTNDIVEPELKEETIEVVEESTDRIFEDVYAEEIPKEYIDSQADIKELDDEELLDEDDYVIPYKEKMSNDLATLTKGERKIVTASGKVIESDSEELQKKIELARAEKYEKSLIKKENREVHKKPYVFPPSNLLKLSENKKVVSDEEYKQTAIKLQQTLHNFGVSVRVTNISCGPVVTRYELSPEQGVKVSKIVALQDDIKLSLAANDIRIEAPIPGKSAVGIEVPNKENNIVYFRELIESKEFKEDKYRLGFAVGKDISGQTVVTDIAKMPHLLIAGATGSGKSVCINTLIMSILYKYSPDDVKLIMVDPKVVELSIYNGIPHLLIPVVTEPKKAASAINWAVAEMTDRYKKFADAGVRDLRGYNEKIEKAKLRGEVEDLPEKLSQIVIIIDELADLMMVAQNEVEEAICRLAQLARACGIHLVIATQRPSVNVITGLIKANIPSRIAFAVTSGVDSRTILDSVGADKLLGKGDMLFSPQGSPKPMRVQGAFISDNEVQDVVDFIKNQGYSESYDMNTLEKIENGSSIDNRTSNTDVDELFLQAGRFIIDKEKASIGNLQRVFKIGFNRAARIMDQLYEAGVVGNEQGTKPREILMDMETFEEKYGSY